MKIYENLPETIESIPAGLLTCVYEGRPVSVAAISPSHVALRLAASIMAKPDTAVPLSFCAYFWDKGHKNYGPFSFTFSGEEQEACYFIACFSISDEAYTAFFRRFATQYQHYIREKLNFAGNEFSASLCNYPAWKDEEFSESYKEWISRKEKSLERYYHYLCETTLPIAISLENEMLWQDYLADSLKFPQRIQEKCTRIYIGNAFCHNLFPDSDVCETLLKKASAKNHAVTIVLSYLRESLYEKEMEKVLALLKQCKRLGIIPEFELNDIGWLPFFQNLSVFSFTLTFGRLIGKRRKDPRFIYKKEMQAYGRLLTETALNDEEFLTYLKGYGISGIEAELCGYEYTLPPARVSLHLPFYQTNTSQYCPLATLVRHGDRSRQELMVNCPKYCKDHVLLYADHLSLIGRYNSIFAFQDWDDALMNRMTEKQMPDRIVWTPV